MILLERWVARPGNPETWIPGSIAVFASNAGTVTISGNILVSAIDFDSTLYDITGSVLSRKRSGAMTITTSGAATAAKIEAAVSASSGMTALGSGTLTLTNSGNSFSETYINAGTLAFSSGALGSGGISFGGGTLEWASGNNQDISSQISIPSGQTANLDTDHSITLASLSGGSGGLNKSGTGTLTITGSASYSGGTTVSAGTLRLGNGTSGGSVSGNININAANAVLEFATPSSGQTYGGIISGSGSVTKSGAGILTLTGTNTFSGAVTISSGALLLGSGSGSVSADIVDNAALQFANSSALTYGGAISGAGSLTKSGSGTLTLTGNNASYTGATSVSGGACSLAMEWPAASWPATFRCPAGPASRLPTARAWATAASSAAPAR